MCRELRKLGPVSIEVIATPDMAPLFRDHFGVDVVHEIRKRPRSAEIRELTAAIGSIDLAVHFSTLIKSRDMFLLHCLQARHTASLDDSVGLVDVPLGAATAGLHMEDKYLELLRCCGIEDADRQYLVPRSRDHEERVSVFLGGREAPFVAINPFSKGRAKTLNPETTRRLIDMLLARLPGTMSVCSRHLAGRARWLQFAETGRKVAAFTIPRPARSTITLPCWPVPMLW
ncbi:glycosyltransferase family 9 protein [Halomonas sp. BC04]|uniref:glycosyltransferase family 9 protein n=1 Tax=Halomonas sp. BC04 TaxID=1403540 RepID=UPI001E49DC0A|nr:hypothetical protein [Halomonas sp. BC04]